MGPGRRALLLLGASPDQIPLVLAARRLGLTTVVADRDPQAPGLALADHPAVVSTRDAGALVELCRGLQACGVPLCGVSVMGSDVPHVVAEVAARMGWPGLPREVASLASHKRRMRERFLEAGIATPRFVPASSARAVIRFWNEVGCDAVVVKPVDQAGSRGVRVVRTAAEVAEAFAAAMAASGCGEVLAEEFVAGPQVSTETLLTETRAETPGFADRNYDDTRGYWPRILENGGWMPSALDGADRKRVCALVERGARALGIVRGVAKGDVVVDPERGPMLIEMAARLGGGDFAASLVPLSCGVDYLPLALQIALGDEPDWNALRADHARVVANRYFFLPPGRLEAIRGAEAVRAWPEVAKLELHAAPGARLQPVTHHGARGGVMVVVAPDRGRATALIDAVYDSVSFRIDGCWRSGRPAPAPEADIEGPRSSRRCRSSAP